MTRFKFYALSVGALCVLVLNVTAGYARYTTMSVFLKDPELTKPYVAQCADFWKKSYDGKYGGFFTMVKRDGSPDSRDEVKTTLTQSRHAYGFARAYMMTGKKEYLDYARHALDFLYDKCWDKKNGGFHTTLDRKGESLDGKKRYPSNGEKWSFMQHYALLGVTAMFDATRGAKDFDMLMKGRGIIDAKLWDTRPGFEGYYETADYDWSHPRDKGFTPTLDCVTTHGLAIYLLTNDAKYRKRLVELADIIVKRIYPTFKTRNLGFEEKYSSDWNEKGDSFLFIGHVLKTAWCLDRAYCVEPKPKYKRISEELLKSIRAKAWDEKYGGPFYLGDSFTGRVTDVEKNWWTLEQAINAGLINYYVTGNEDYLALADQSADFYEKHLIDRKYGEVFAGVDADGSTPTSQMKGDYWKAGYHSIETGYYLYMYGMLFVHRKPVSLFYMIEKSDRARVIPLNPIAAGERKLVIKKVTLNDESYKGFNGTARTLAVPAGIGGEFRVTFAIKE
jgi:mannose/cellobiose epimerase-like protein (N-acyl-D-glucosamine 2-epimerase family)